MISFEFSKLTDPWESKYGFSLPLIEMYIDNKEGGRTELFQKGANVKLDPENPWDRLFKLSGWWLRVYEPSDISQITMDYREDIEETPSAVKNSKIKVEDNVIKIEIKKEILGPLKDANVFLIVGSFDPFGPDHFRGVVKEPSSWSFSDQTSDNLKYAPRVIDTVLPENYKQEIILGEFKDDYPVLKPITLKSSSDKVGFFMLKNRYLFFLILLAGLAFILNKRDFFRNNK
jgi:carbohydrate-binding DOMON domain-containing protein